MEAVILAAGRGTRLAALGLDVPKPLVEVGGEPLLARQLRYLAGQGVQHVVVNAHHLASAIQSFAREYKSPPEISVVVEDELLGTAGGVRNAVGQLGEEPVIVLYGDVVLDAPLAPMLSCHERLGADATLAVYETTETLGKGTLDLDAQGNVIAFREKAAADPAAPALVNAGLYVLEPRLLSDIPPGVPLDFGHDVFPSAIAAGRRLGAYLLPEPVIDVGTPEGLARARALAQPVGRRPGSDQGRPGPCR